MLYNEFGKEQVCGHNSEIDDDLYLQWTVVTIFWTDELLPGDRLR